MLPIKNYSKQPNPCAHESTVSGRIYLRIISPWQAQEYVVKLFFLQLLSPEIAIARVRQSAAPGRLNMAEDVIRRRFHAGMRNFERVYKPLVNEWVLFDNSGEEPVRLN